MLEILVVIFSVCSLIQVYFWIVKLDTFNRANHPKTDVDPPSLPSVSVIIASKNAFAQLSEHLPLILAQDYLDYEVIVVDDHSSDETPLLIEQGGTGQLNHERLVFLSSSKEDHGKKAAVTKGIEQAQGEWILLTDADCYPNSSSWISSMMSLSGNCDVVLGYSPMIEQSGILNKWIRYETHFIALQYLSAALLGDAYMGVGRNMAYKKSLFEKVGGFKMHKDLKSGDDDLFIASLGTKVKFGINAAPDAWMWTYAQKSLNDYIQQKRRHLTTAPRYRMGTKMRLALYYTSHLFWYISCVWLSLFQPIWLLALLVRASLIIFVMKRSEQRLGGGPYMILSPVFDAGLCLFYLVMSLGYVWKKEGW